jgi:hypothetical protein
MSLGSNANFAFIEIQTSDECAAPVGFVVLKLRGSKHDAPGWLHAHWSQIASYGPSLQMLTTAAEAEHASEFIGTRLYLKGHSEQYDVDASIEVIARTIAFAKKEDSKLPHLLSIVICPSCQRHMLPDFERNEWKCLSCRYTVLAKYSPHPL